MTVCKRTPGECVGSCSLLSHLRVVAWRSQVRWPRSPRHCSAGSTAPRPYPYIPKTLTTLSKSGPAVSVLDPRILNLKPLKSAPKNFLPAGPLFFCRSRVRMRDDILATSRYE
ncbi:hypothetical protein FVEG_15660 [Fusarium verticillioides 7600]|uniref:Uncharacterized protein n=1 Tax=Gibberella moniliformis (strain M3125 / FGSC 7600) TaxID=334819 RepID=W7M0H8_GIBM7|nr:hypothetical protein FVEG_15660 [Fusarium verticillioides 7600]EWG44456.1 hypothetical protein FVEG_15660 [Fusarium verticillioides 7600]